MILWSPGAFGMPDVYDTTIEKLRAKGVDVRALHLPSVGPAPQQSRPGKGPNMYDDAAFIAKEAEKEADAGRNVILLAHSYSGAPVCQAPQGLTAKERRAQGKKGGIVSLAFISSLVPALGESGADVYGRSPEGGKAIPMEPIVSAYHPVRWSLSELTLNVIRRVAGWCRPTLKGRLRFVCRRSTSSKPRHSSRCLPTFRPMLTSTS